MNRKHKRFLGTILSLLFLICVVPLNCQAQGTTTIHVSGSQLNVGDLLTVTVTASESGSISLAYNTEVLQFSGSGASYTTDGNTLTFEGTTASFQFQCTSQGKSSLVVSSPTITGSSAVVNVNGTAAATEEQPQQTPSADTSAKGQFNVDGIEYVVSERYPESAIPAGFERIRVTIDGYAYKELSNGSIVLLYLKPASDTSGEGEFYQYDETNNSVTLFSMIGTADHYVVLATPDTLLLESFAETSLDVDGKSVTVYQNGTEGDFYFVYGTNQAGVTGWFQYDRTDGSLQRVNEQLLTSVEETKEEAVTTSGGDEYMAKWKQLRYIVAIMAFVVVVLLVVVANLIWSRRQRMDAWDEEDPDYYDEEEDIEETVILDEDEGADEEMVSDCDTEEPETDETGIDDVFVEKPAKKRTTESADRISYGDIRGTEAFQSKENTRYKGADADTQLDILDLNDL